jgi:hypothetical protein
MAIHVIQSQRIDVLLQAMQKTVFKPAKNAFQVLQAQHFIVPSPAVEAANTKVGRTAGHQCQHAVSSSYSWFSMVGLSVGFGRPKR